MQRQTQQRFGINEQNIELFIANLTTTLEANLKVITDTLVNLNNQLHSMTQLKSLNTNPTQLVILQETARKILLDELHEKNKNKIYVTLLQQLKTMLENYKNSPFYDFFYRCILNKKYIFDGTIEPHSLFQKQLLEFLGANYIYASFNNSFHLSNLRKHYLNVCTHYLLHKIAANNKDEKKQAHELVVYQQKFSQLVNEYFTNILIIDKRNEQHLLQGLLQIFPSSKQAKKVYNFLLLLKTHTNTIAFENALQKFIHTEHSYHYTKEKDSSFGVMLQNDPFNPALYQENIQACVVQEAETNYLLPLKKYLDNYYHENSKTNLAIIEQHLQLYGKLSKQNFSIVLKIISIISNANVKYVVDPNLQTLENQKTNLCYEAKSILDLYANLQKDCGELPVWNKFLKATDDLQTDVVHLLRYQNASTLLDEEKLYLEEQVIWQERLANTKEDLTEQMKIHLPNILRIQFLIAARFYFQNHNSYEDVAINIKVFNIIKRTQEVTTFQDLTNVVGEILIKEQTKSDFAKLLLQVLHDEEFGMFYLITNKLDTYIHTNIRKYFNREFTASDLNSWENLNNFLLNHHLFKAKFSGNQAQKIGKLGNKDLNEVCYDSQLTLETIDRKVEKLQRPKSPTTFAQTMLFAPVKKMEVKRESINSNYFRNKSASC